MTRAAMEAMLARRLNEPTAGDQWTPAERKELLNAGLQATQMKLLECDPSAVLRKSRCDLVAAQHEYEWPVEMVYEVEVALKNASTGEYTVIDKKPYDVVRDNTGAEATQYAHWGRYCYLAPAPESALVAGLQAIFVPLLTMADDTSVPDLPMQWHMAVVLNAQILALGEGADSAKSAMAEREALYGQLAAGHRNSAAAPTPLQPDINRDYGADYSWSAAR
jgi:hypothetical protein